MAENKIPAPIRAALLEVHEKGLKDGNEHMVVLEPKTLAVAGRSNGDKFSVSMPEECRREDVPWTIIHNHPGKGISLSLQDLCCAASFGGMVLAIDDDKMVYAAKPLVRDPHKLWDHGLLCGCAQGAKYQHSGNLELRRAGLIEYEYERLEKA